MALAVLLGSKGNKIPVVFRDPSLITGRISYPNDGTLVPVYGSVTGFGTPAGWQCFQQGGFTLDPATLSEYAIFNHGTNYIEFSVFGDGVAFGDGKAFVTSDGLFIDFDCPTQITISGTTYQTFISGPPVPSHWSQVGGVSVGRYSIGVQLTTGTPVYTPPNGTSMVFWSDWFDIVLSLPLGQSSGIVPPFPFQIGM